MILEIWNDRDLMISCVWENYRKKTLEKVLNKNIEEQKRRYDDYQKGVVPQEIYENGKVTINWVETYEFFPSLESLQSQDQDAALFFKEIEEPYNYNVSFLLEHYKERKLIFNHLEFGLGTWDMVVEDSIITFAPYSKPALQLLEKLFDLQRFLRAQEFTYLQALKEVHNGKKTTHWMWYIFPQMKGLGKSTLSQTYGVNWREARAYIQHPILRERLVEISEAVYNSDKSVYEIFGNDAIKVRSCMKLFASISKEPVFKKMINKYVWN